MTAVQLLLDCHGQLLRELSVASGRHFQGLAQAARTSPWLSTRTRRRLRELDCTAAFIRHVTKPLIADFVSEVEAELKEKFGNYLDDTAADFVLDDAPVVQSEAARGDGWPGVDLGYLPEQHPSTGSRGLRAVGSFHPPPTWFGG